MDQSNPRWEETENDSFDRKGVSNGEAEPSSDVSSFYEINVHENHSSESNTSKGSGYFYVRPKMMVQVKKVGGNKEKENNHNTTAFVENLKKIANPLIESYPKLSINVNKRFVTSDYPFLENHQFGNITIEVNVSPLNSDGKKREEKKESTDKSVEEKSGENSSWNKSDESVTRDDQGTKGEKKLAISNLYKMRKKLKRQILQNILTKKDGEFKDLQWGDVENDQLHIHHHEHHHHYYMDTTKLKDESEFSLLQTGSHSPVHWLEDKENDFRRTDLLNSDLDVKERERCNYLYDCRRHHPVNFLMGKNSCNLSNLTFGRTSKDEFMKIADKYSPLKPVKKASSMDSLSRKKSDLIDFHTYSDTEMSKCDSVEGSSTDVPSSRSALNMIRNMKKNIETERKRSKVLCEEREVVAGHVVQENDSNCSVLKKSSDEKYHERKKASFEIDKTNKKRRNLTDLLDKFKTSGVKNENSRGEFQILVKKKAKKSDESRKEARDYFTRPVRKISSECEPVDVKTDKETSDENVKSTTTVSTSVKDTGTVVGTSEEESSKSCEKCNRSKPPKSANTLIFTAQKSDRDLNSRKVSLQCWSQKLRQELKEIKKELRSLEKRHTRELVQMRASCSDEYCENGISVYSSRTYIIGARHFKRANGLPRKGDFTASFKDRNMFTQKQIVYLYSSPNSRGWSGVQHHTESKFSTNEKSFYWNQHFVSRETKVRVR